jgi:hypothetical protein
MQKNILYILIFSITIFSSCNNTSAKKEDGLTTAKIEAYLDSYKDLREKAPELLANANNGNPLDQQAGFNSFETVLKKHGLTYKEFVILNAKIGAIFSIQQAENFMGEMEEMKTAGMQQMDAGAQQIQASLNDPNVPEEAKKELRKSLAEMKAAKSTINNDYDKNKGWADLVMDKAKTVTNVFLSKEDIELVKQYSPKITEAYTGMAPTNFNVQQ